MKYEYKVLTLHLDSDDNNDAVFEKVLNKFGGCGWELTAVDVDHSSDSYYLFLKRVIMEGKTL